MIQGAQSLSCVHIVMRTTVTLLSLFEAAHYFQEFMGSNSPTSKSDQCHISYLQNLLCHINMFLFLSWKEGKYDLKCETIEDCELLRP